MQAFEGLVVEDQAPAGLEGLEDDVLHGQGAFVGDTELAAALLRADVLLLIRQRLDEDGATAVPGLPVKRQEADNLRRQVGPYAALSPKAE